MRDSLSFGRWSQSNSPAIQISEPMHNTPADGDSGRPKYQATMQQPSGVGLAIVPSHTSSIPSGATPTRPPQQATAAAVATSPSLPRGPPRSQTPKSEMNLPRPTLTLAIPTEQSKTVRRPPAARRDSTVTEFAEDGEGENASGKVPIWRPPPTDPQSATTYYFADKGGNWVLRNKSTRNPGTNQPSVPTVQVELPSPNDKTKAERAKGFDGWFTPGAAVSPLRVPSRPAQQRLGSPIAFKEQQPRRETRSSSVYSPYNAPISVAAGSENPLPEKLPQPETNFEMARGGRDLVPTKSKRKSARGLGARVSTGSATSIESAAAPPFEDEDIIEDELQVDLSPVVESPRSLSSPGRSPVAYPKIHSRSRQQQLEEPSGTGQGLSLFPPRPKGAPPRTRRQPNFAPGMVVPVKKPALGQLTTPDAPSLNPNPNRNPGQQRTGSPDVRAGVMGQQQQPRRQQQDKFSSAQYGGPQSRQEGGRMLSPEPAYNPFSEGVDMRQQQAYWGLPSQNQQDQRRQSQWRPTPQPHPLPSQNLDPLAQGLLLM